MIRYVAVDQNVVNRNDVIINADGSICCIRSDDDILDKILMILLIEM